MTPAEQKAFDAMRGALKKMIKSRDDHAFQEEKHVESEFGAYWSPSASMIDSEAVAIGRKALAAANAMREQARCQYCDGTGDVHTPTGEWRGSCGCEAARTQATEPAQAAFARLDKCEGKPDGTCDKCGGSCMWFGKPAAPEAA